MGRLVDRAADFAAGVAASAATAVAAAATTTGAAAAEGPFERVWPIAENMRGEKRKEGGEVEGYALVFCTKHYWIYLSCYVCGKRIIIWARSKEEEKKGRERKSGLLSELAGERQAGSKARITLQVLLFDVEKIRG